MEGLDNLFSKMSICELRLVKESLDGHIERAYQNKSLTWAGNAAIISPPQSKPAPKGPKIYRDLASGKEYIRVCKSPACDCRYYLKENDDCESLKLVNSEALFVHGFNPRLDYDANRHNLSILLRTACVKLFEDIELTIPVSIEPDTKLINLIKNALRKAHYYLVYKNQKLYIREEDVPFPKNTFVKPSDTFGFCWFDSHEKACRAKQIIESFQRGCTFLLEKK